MSKLIWYEIWSGRKLILLQQLVLKCLWAYGHLGFLNQYVCIQIRPQLKKCGPWGSQGSTNWSFNFNPSKPIREVIFRTGFIVDGIGFVLADNSGETRYFGGQEGSPSKVKHMTNFLCMVILFSIAKSVASGFAF